MTNKLLLFFAAAAVLLGGCAHDTRRFIEPSVGAVGRATDAVGVSVKASKALAKGIEAKGTLAGSVEAKQLVSRLETADNEVSVLKLEVANLKSTINQQTKDFKEALVKGEKYDRLGHELNRWFYFGAYWYGLRHQFYWLAGVAAVVTGLCLVACWIYPGALLGLIRLLPAVFGLLAVPFKIFGSLFGRTFTAVALAGRGTLDDVEKKLAEKSAAKQSVRKARVFTQ
jgi:hypothetical protein